MQRVLFLPPRIRVALIMICDAGLVFAALWLALSLRLGRLNIDFNQYAIAFFTLTFVSVGAFQVAGLYQIVTRRINIDLFSRIIKATALSVMLLLVITLVAPTLYLPRALFLIYGSIIFAFLLGSRVLFNGLVWEKWTTSKPGIRLAVYGAGSSGVQVVNMLREGTEYVPVLFFDDNPALHDRKVEGLKIFNPDPARLAGLLKSNRIDQILLCMPSATRAQRRRAVDRFKNLNYPLLTIPHVKEMFSENAKTPTIRDVKIEDLLGRECVPPDDRLLARCITGRTVMITGAGGAIGTELCRQVLQKRPGQMLLFDQSEYGLYKIEQELNQMAAEMNLDSGIIPLLGHVTDRNRLKRIFTAYDIDTVYHAAAYKHVPLVQYNTEQGIFNNTMGTRYLAEQACRSSVRHFVFVSTDKAVRPTNVMGASKRLGEMIIQALQENSTNTIFSIVRFGNVLGSSGSVIPLFQKQIQKGGPVTVTHAEVTRYFMTISEAVQLVIQAGAMAHGGDVFVLDMGESVKILDLAKRMIRLSGLDIKDDERPDGDIEIKITGLRPGEKIIEELLIGDNVSKTEHSKILRAEEAFLPWDSLSSYLDALEISLKNYDLLSVQSLLLELVSGYVPGMNIDDLVWKRTEKDSKLAPLH